MGSTTVYEGDGSYHTFNVLPADWLRLATDRAPGDIAVIEGDGSRTTYTELNAQVNRVADLLLSLGVRKGHRVATMATDSRAHFEVMLAAFKVGATFMPLNFRLSRREVDVLVERGAPTVLFHSARYAELLHGVTATQPSLEALICLDGATGDSAGYADLVAGRATTEPVIERIEAEDIGILAFTSGTTGMPKGVQTSFRMAHSICITQLMEMEVRRSDIFLTSSPMFHSAGYFQMLMCLFVCCPVIILPQFEPVEVQQWLTREDGPSAIFMVPTMIRKILDVPGAKDVSYPRLHMIGYGGAPMPPALLREAIEVFGCDFANSFGAGTENGASSWLTPGDHRRAAAGEWHLLGSVGRPGLGTEMRICDEDLNDVPTGIVGEIVTRNNMTMSGYLEMPDRSAHSLPGDGWFRAGDLGYRDEEGYLWLQGRATDMIIRGGENVYPLEIEHVLAEFAAVSECAVVGVPDDHWGESVRAWVVLREGHSAEPGELEHYCSEHLGRYKVPNEYWFVDELPKNASGKILKRELVTWDPERVSAVGGPVTVA